MLRINQRHRWWLGSRSAKASKRRARRTRLGWSKGAGWIPEGSLRESDHLQGWSKPRHRLTVTGTLCLRDEGEREPEAVTKESVFIFIPGMSPLIQEGSASVHKPFLKEGSLLEGGLSGVPRQVTEAERTHFKSPAPVLLHLPECQPSSWKFTLQNHVNTLTSTL